MNEKKEKVVKMMKELRQSMEMPNFWGDLVEGPTPGLATLRGLSQLQNILQIF